MSFGPPWRLVQLGALSLLMASGADAQSAPSAAAASSQLRALSTSLESLTRSVSTSVVQVLVTGYGRIDNSASGGDAGLVIGRQRSIGSGAIIDPSGYIITNAHVVAGARHVQVVLHRDTTAAGPVGSLAADDAETVEARIIGTAADIDLALLKVDAAGLPALPLANYDAIRQGELVFAFGSPEGLRNSVSMGVVSSVARQPDPDSPAFYIQTDAPINPGNSGGPLVNVNGELVGLNTFILTESGGSQGLGFAIPSAIVASVYPQLLKYGHLHRGILGFNTQAITPALAAGLNLPRHSGVMVSDVLPEGPADAAGLEIQDVIVTINGKPVSSVPMLALELSRYVADDTVRLELRRGTEEVSISVVVQERPHPIDDLVSLADPEKNTVAKLGILGVDVNSATAALLPQLREASGVFVAARTGASAGNDVPLVAGDVIHAVNTVPVRSLDGLSALVNDAKPDTTLILQVERSGLMLFLTCDIF